MSIDYTSRGVALEAVWIRGVPYVLASECQEVISKLEDAKILQRERAEKAEAKIKELERVIQNWMFDFEHQKEALKVNIARVSELEAWKKKAFKLIDEYDITRSIDHDARCSIFIDTIGKCDCVCREQEKDFKQLITEGES